MTTEPTDEIVQVIKRVISVLLVEHLSALTPLVERAVCRYAQERSTAHLRVFSLEEVHEMTRIPLRALTQDCRAGRLEHVHHGNLRGMTLDQIARLLAMKTSPVVRGSGLLDSLGLDDAELRDARESSRRNMMRGRRYRG